MSPGWQDTFPLQVCSLLHMGIQAGGVHRVQKEVRDIREADMHDCLCGG